MEAKRKMFKCQMACLLAKSYGFHFDAFCMLQLNNWFIFSGSQHLPICVDIRKIIR